MKIFIDAVIDFKESMESCYPDENVYSAEDEKEYEFIMVPKAAYKDFVQTVNQIKPIRTRVRKREEEQNES